MLFRTSVIFKFTLWNYKDIHQHQITKYLYTPTSHKNYNIDIEYTYETRIHIRNNQPSNRPIIDYTVNVDYLDSYL